LVLAGAGSGKTRVLTTRIARLVYEKRCKPEQILAVTFTNKAAREMKERIAALTSSKTADAMTLSTFHSLGVKILREDGEKIGFAKSFSIIDEHEKVSTLKSIMRAAGVRGLKTRIHRSLHTKSVWQKTAHLILNSLKKKTRSE
jgi:superfamily I DNA/RNA helicase